MRILREYFFDWLLNQNKLCEKKRRTERQGFKWHKDNNKKHVKSKYCWVNMSQFKCFVDIAWDELNTILSTRFESLFNTCNLYFSLSCTLLFIFIDFVFRFLFTICIMYMLVSKFIITLIMKSVDYKFYFFFFFCFT